MKGAENARGGRGEVGEVGEVEGRTGRRGGRVWGAGRAGKGRRNGRGREARQHLQDLVKSRKGVVVPLKALRSGKQGGGCHSRVQKNPFARPAKCVNSQQIIEQATRFSSARCTYGAPNECPGCHAKRAWPLQLPSLSDIPRFPPVLPNASVASRLA